MYRNNTNFPLQNYQKLKELKLKKSDDEAYHQQLVVEYYKTGVRGVLAAHGMGTGKTRLAMLVARELNMRTVIIAPTKVFGKFEQEREKVGWSIEPTYISLRANNLSEQIERLESVSLDFDISHNTQLDNTFVIVDEAHNLFNAVVNGSKNAVDFYDRVMSAKGIRLLFLSGSPIVNTPFELAVCFNMLGNKLFPENSVDFEKYFIELGRPKNADKFKNRIFGLVSYFGEYIAQGDQNRPERLPTQIVRVPMSESQYGLYSTYRDKERLENATRKRRDNVDRFSKKSSNSSYRIRSRMTSNCSGDKPTPENAPKLYKVVDLVHERLDRPGCVYSNFVHKAGLQDIAYILEKRGWRAWKSGDKVDKSVNRYAIISGDTNEEMTNLIQEVASNIDNRKGDIIRTVLLGPAAAEGIEFHNFRYVIITDPFFNAIRSDQVEHRIDRIGSHELLPKEERNYEIIYTLAIAPVKTKEPSTDEYLYKQSQIRRALSMMYFRLLIEASFDCSLHRDKLSSKRAVRINCMMCAPNNRKLFTDDLDTDIASDNPCGDPKMEKIKAREIIIDDVSYMEAQGVYYRYSDELGGYVKVKRNEPIFDQLVKL